MRFSREKVHGTRWRAEVEGVPPPRTVSKEFGGKRLEIDAAKLVLAFVWAVAKREHPTIECPYVELIPELPF